MTKWQPKRKTCSASWLFIVPYSLRISGSLPCSWSAIILANCAYDQHLPVLPYQFEERCNFRCDASSGDVTSILRLDQGKKCCLVGNCHVALLYRVPHMQTLLRDILNSCLCVSIHNTILCLFVCLFVRQRNWVFIYVFMCTVVPLFYKMLLYCVDILFQ
jgi:hypothetical protein